MLKVGDRVMVLRGDHFGEIISFPCAGRAKVWFYGDDTYRRGVTLNVWENDLLHLPYPKEVTS